MAKLTLIGMHNYMQSIDEDLFQNIGTLFANLYEMDPRGEVFKEHLSHSLLDRAGEFETLYADPYYMRDYIQRVCMRYRESITRMYKALHIEYDPLSNYDRTETTTVITDGESTTVNSGSDKVTTVGTNEGSSTGESETNKLISAFNSDTLVPDDKNVITDGTTTRSENESTTTNDIDNSSKVDTDTVVTTESRIKGNIGVTTSQQMLQSEIEISRINFFNEVADMLAPELTIMVY